MKFLSARRAVSTGIVAAASVAAFAVPSAANAALPGHCAGTTTEGAGSSLQAEAQIPVWDPGFSANKSAGCISGPKVTYRSIGSGAGYKEWNEKEKFGEVGFVGTDNTVNLSEKESVESKPGKTGTSKLLTLPVLQGAIAIVVHLPEGCTATSSKASGRLEVNQSALEGVYKGSITTWAAFVAANEGTGDALSGGSCNTASKITPVVRLDSSGTTHIFKKFLNLSDNSKLASEDGKEHTWAELAEGSLSTKWPNAAGVLKAETETGPGLLKTVAKNAGTIGYANLADAENTANGNFKPGESTATFWTPFESSRKEKTTSKGLKITRKWAEPVKGSESNCKDTEFTNGPNGEGGTFPPPSVDSAWNEVTGADQSKSYALCGLTYDLVLTNYAAYSAKGGNANEAQTVKDFMSYVLSKKGGAKEIKAHFYSPLPKAVEKEAQEGVSLIED
jgi:phosphate transport system substrate-binding protein